MILLDANLLIYAHAPEMPQHERARNWLEQAMETTPRVGIPWPSILAFLRICTNPRLFRPAATVAAAWELVGRWFAADNTWIPCPTERHGQMLEPLLAHAGGGGNLIADAHLAALALEHGLTLYSADGDFARFPGLRWINPLSS